MPKDLATIIHYFETHNNNVTKDALKKDLEFKENKIQKMILGRDLLRLETGNYALHQDFYKQFQISFPQGSMRLDKQSFEFHADVPRADAEKLVKSKILERTQNDNLLIKRINIIDNRFDIEFVPARYSAVNNHVVFDAISRSQADLIREARRWEGHGRWELGQYFRKVAEFSPKDYHQHVAEVILSVREKHGDIGRLEKLSEHHNMIVPAPLPDRSKLQPVMAEVRLDKATGTYFFGNNFHEVSEQRYKSLFSDVSSTLGFHAKRFVSMTFKKILPAIGVAFSLNRIAKAEDKVEATMEEATIATGAVEGGLIGALLGATTGPFGMAAFGIAGSLAGSELTNAYHAMRKHESKKANTTTITQSQTQQSLSQKVKKSLFSLFDARQRVDEEFAERDARLEANKKKEQQQAESKAEQIRAQRAWYHFKSPENSSNQSALPETKKNQSSESISSSSTTTSEAKKHKKKAALKQKKHASQPSAEPSSSSSSREPVSNSPSEEDKRVADFLISWGASPVEVVEIYRDEEAWKSAKDALTQITEYERKLELRQDHENYITFFNGVGTICLALSQVKNPELAHIGKVAVPIMFGLAQIETLWGVFSGEAGMLATHGFAASFGNIACLVAVGICLVDMALSGDDGEQLMESLNALQQHIYMFRREVHERFDRIENGISQVASMLSSYCNQILRNQQAIYEQNKQHYELSLQGFRMVNTMIRALHAENRNFHEQTIKKLSYLISLQENEPLQKLKDAITDKISNILAKSKMGPPSEIRAEMMLDKFLELQSDLERCAASDYNGRKEYKLLKKDSLESIQFLTRRFLNKDDALGFFAEEMERITEKPLLDAGIQKEILPVSTLWFNTVHKYMRLSHLPVFEGVNKQETLQKITAQFHNLVKFLQHIPQSEVIQKLLEQHRFYLNQFQEVVFHLFTDRKKLLIQSEEKKSEYKSRKKSKISEYFHDGNFERVTLDIILQRLDYVYLLLNRFAYLGDLPTEARLNLKQLEQSKDLLE